MRTLSSREGQSYGVDRFLKNDYDCFAAGCSLKRKCGGSLWYMQLRVKGQDIECFKC